MHISSISLRVNIFLLLSLLALSAANGQIADNDSLFVQLPAYPSFQSLASETQLNDSVYLYVGIDEGKHGSIKTLSWNGDIHNNTLKQVRSFELPQRFEHPNDLQVIGDSLLVTGWNKTAISNIGWVDKKTGNLLSIITDTIPNGMWLQFSFYYQQVLYRGITNGNVVRLQKLISGQGFVTIVPNLGSGWMHYVNQPIQGSKVIGNYLAILSSFPSRIDLYNISTGFTYKCSLYGEYNQSSGGPETEGLTMVERGPDSVYVFFGLKPPNRINYFGLTKQYLYNICGTEPSPHNPPLTVKTITNPLSIQEPVEYFLEEDAPLTVTVYNMLGAKELELYSGKPGPGFHVLDISSAANLSGGLYFLRFNTESYYTTLKIFYLR